MKNSPLLIVGAIAVGIGVLYFMSKKARANITPPTAPPVGPIPTAYESGQGGPMQSFDPHLSAPNSAIALTAQGGISDDYGSTLPLGPRQAPS